MFPYIDPRDKQLAQTLINYSVRAGSGDLVYIQCIGRDTLGLGAACAEEATRAGAAPYVQLTEPEMQRRYLMETSRESLERLARFEMAQMKDTTCYIGLRGSENIFEMADVPRQQMELYNQIVYRPVHLEVRVKQTRWCVLRYPTSSMAQQAEMSRESFAEFYYRVCCVDYEKMAQSVQPLQQRMEKAKEVHISGEETDLHFSIEGIGTKPCCGEHNIPDGECFTAPVRESIEGTVAFNAPAIREGFGYEQIRLRFEKGRAVEAFAANPQQTEKLNKVLDQDEGARYVGEFALGFNPGILEPMRDTLFDEKIAGSFHMALGQCYEQEAPNGNSSTIHWDLVCIQRPEKGGGEIYFDGELIRKDGLFIPSDLQGLNPQALLP